MAHFSEMDFLFSNLNNKNSIAQQLEKTSPRNEFNIFKGSPNYVVYKSKLHGTNGIKEQISKTIYNEENKKNPYIKLLNDFNKNSGENGAALKLRAADIAYLKDLGVYPINRMVILRRFKDGILVPENLEELLVEPISTIVGWIKPDDNFGSISFNESWSTTNDRFDLLLAKLIKQATGGLDLTALVPLPDFLQGVLFEFYNKAGLSGGGATDTGTNEKFESFDGSKLNKPGSDENWGLLNLPMGDPNMLNEGPFRNPDGQNIKSSFSFDITTTYEQKLLGSIDPGSAMLDIIDNIYAMGTSNMRFYFNEDSGIINKARNAVIGNDGKGNDLGAWWSFLKEVFNEFWGVLRDLFSDIKQSIIDYNVNELTGPNVAKLFKEVKDDFIENVLILAKSILTSTIARFRYELRGSIELTTGGRYSSTPWYLTIGNPYSPWLATNHIVVDSCSIETSTEMGFNDQPQQITAKFNCRFSRSLGKQELMRMFNNSYRRTYNNLNFEMIKSITLTSSTQTKNIGLQPMSSKIVNQTQPTPGKVGSPNTGNYDSDALYNNSINRT